jgi:hypothetical protein
LNEVKLDDPIKDGDESKAERIEIIKEKCKGREVYKELINKL